MKRFIKCVCLILAMSLCLALPVAAAEQAPYGSSYFGSRDAFLWSTSDTSFEAWFEITALRGMTELGAKYIDIERSSDGVNWQVVKTYNRSSYSNMIANNTSDHCSYVTYSNVEPGYQYRMFVLFYAKDANGNIATSGKYGYLIN